MRFSVRWNVGQKRHVDPSALRNVSGMEFKPSWLFNQRFLRKLMVARRRRAKTSESISRFIDSLIVVCRRTFQGWLVDDEIGFQCHNSCRNGNQCFLHDRSDTIASTGSRDNPSLNGFFLASQKKNSFSCWAEIQLHGNRDLSRKSLQGNFSHLKLSPRKIAARRTINQKSIKLYCDYSICIFPLFAINYTIHAETPSDPRKERKRTKLSASRGAEKDWKLNEKNHKHFTFYWTSLWY